MVHHPKSLPVLLESFQVITRFTYIVELYVEVRTIKYLIALDLSIGFFLQANGEKNFVKV
jgi:hypothetical protein